MTNPPNPNPSPAPKAELKPAAVISVGGTVGAMHLSPNRKWLFLLPALIVSLAVVLVPVIVTTLLAPYYLALACRATRATLTGFVVPRDLE